MGAYYITTDLDLRARFDITLLDDELQKAGLHSGGIQKHGPTRGSIWVPELQEAPSYWSAGYSCGPCVYCPASALRHLIEAVDGLTSDAQELWERCYSRRFDMGFQGDHERFASRWQIPGPLLRRLADIDVDLVITIYRADQTNVNPSNAR